MYFSAGFTKHEPFKVPARDRAPEFNARRNN
jgi:hypothetical protein